VKLHLCDVSQGKLRGCWIGSISGLEAKGGFFKNNKLMELRIELCRISVQHFFLLV
jgi:hypothetical protein